MLKLAMYQWCTMLTGISISTEKTDGLMLEELKHLFKQAVPKGLKVSTFIYQGVTTSTL